MGRYATSARDERQKQRGTKAVPSVKQSVNQTNLYILDSNDVLR
jgi:hypothetical protein